MPIFSTRNQVVLSATETFAGMGILATCRAGLPATTQFAGTLGAAGCFSFYPGKNLGAWGEGGAVSTDDEELAAQIRTLRDHGRLSHYAHSAYGYNARLDTLQAAVLRPKLERLEDWNARRRISGDSARRRLDPPLRARGKRVVLSPVRNPQRTA